MRATPSNRLANWPDFENLREIKFLHNAFIVELYLAADLSFKFRAGESTTSFTPEQMSWYVRNAKTWLAEAAMKGVEPFLEVVLQLPAVAQGVLEMEDEEASDLEESQSSETTE